ncbi:MAG: hypothetical protein JRJ31_15665 [Deltaproteobacteria bacterium]|nr:hypothetical protein [Deltaproteobacteria bacterium]
MSWTLYRWVWKLRSPLHIGLTRAGSLNRTRLYIPARNMWAALTAEIARQQAGTDFPDYEDTGQKLQEHARFTYLFPAERVDSHWRAWLPRYEKDYGLRWHREDGGVEPLPDRRFRRRLLHTRPTTAIAHSSGAAEEGTLREVECIVECWRPQLVQDQSGPSPVAFVGYIFLKDTLPLAMQNLLKELGEIFMGGETRYGFGHLSLLPHSPQKPWQHTSDCFWAQVNFNADNPVIEGLHHVLAHTHQDRNPVKMGAWELLVQWNWGTFQNQASPFWAPGSQVGNDVRFNILDSGLWQAQE